MMVASTIVPDEGVVNGDKAYWKEEDRQRPCSRWPTSTWCTID